MENGAIKLQKVIRKLQNKGLPPDLSIYIDGSGLVKIEKRSASSSVEFSFLFRTEKMKAFEIWWPINYNSSQEDISCENIINGKTFVNLSKQTKLIELTNTWAKSLEAQFIVKTVNRALL